MLIRKITQYLTQNGERIEELRLVDTQNMDAAVQSTEEEPAFVYLGIILIPVGVSDSSGNMIDVRPQEYRFGIEADSLEKACEKFAAASEEAIKDLKQRSEERKKQSDHGLIIPNAEQSEQINNFKLGL